MSGKGGVELTMGVRTDASISLSFKHRFPRFSVFTPPNNSFENISILYLVLFNAVVKKTILK